LLDYGFNYYLNNKGTPINVKLNDTLLVWENNPLLINGTALVPLREFSNAVGAKLEYLEEEKQILIIYGKTAAKLKLGENFLEVNHPCHPYKNQRKNKDSLME